MSLAAEMGVLHDDASDCIDLASVPVTIIRHLRSARVKGRSPDPVTKKILAETSIQPMTGKDLERLPEGMKTTGTKKIYSTVELMTVKTSECRVPDRVLYKSETYQIEESDDWQDLGGYFKYVATRVER